jgi:hypothetical protein
VNDWTLCTLQNIFFLHIYGFSNVHQQNNHNNWFIYSIHILNHKSYRNLLSAILNTGLYLLIILYIWIFSRYLLFYSIFDEIPIDKHIYNNNQSLNVQNTCCKFLPDSISAIFNIWTIDDHLVYFNKNLLFIVYFVGNYKKYIYEKNNQYHRNTEFASGLHRTSPDSTGLCLVVPLSTIYYWMLEQCCIFLFFILLIYFDGALICFNLLCFFAINVKSCICLVIT